jgi:pimeloyl-ACP methyl ester carboxylesterase
MTKYRKIDLYSNYDGTFPFKPHFTNAPGFAMHYVDEGRQGDETILCLHGEPTWGYLFRHLIPMLSEEYRVVVPDHMGFGKSATPQDRSYWLQDHIDFPNAPIHRLVGVGHYCLEDAPDEIGRLIVDFIRRN